MRSVVWATLLVVATIGGCAEQVEPVNEVEADPTPSAGNETLESFMVSLVAGNATAGQNIAIELGIDAPASLNASLVAWSLQAYNASLATGANDTSLANGTGEGTSLANGTGLPAVLNITLDAGNHTLRLEAVADGFQPANATLGLAVLEGLPDDPCAGVGVQEPIPFSGLFTAAVMGTGFFAANPFDVGPCQTKIFVEVTSSEAALDPMLRLKDAGGATVDEEDNEFLYHDTLTYEPGGYLEPGTWQIDVRGYAAGPGNYEGTVSFE